MKMYTERSYLTAIALFIMLSLAAAAGAEEAYFYTVNSQSHCCFDSALTVEFPPGTSTITYVSGAWQNAYYQNEYFGCIRVEIPAIGLVVDLGTDEQIEFDNYSDAEAAAIGDEEIVLNNTTETITGYFFVRDSCPQGGVCGDNVGEVIIDVSAGSVLNNETSWGVIKAIYR